MKRKLLTVLLFAVASAPVCLGGFVKKITSRSVRSVVFALSFTSLGFPAQVSAAVHAVFELSTPVTAPFPSDWFTVPDASHSTRRRVNLPLPKCAARPSDCEDLNVINTLDGFSSDPRLSIPFDGPIAVTTVTSETVFLVRLGSMFCDGDDDCDDDGDDGGHVTGFNQVVWDPATNTLHVKSNEFLDQHTRYGVIVTNRLRDGQGRPVEASKTFRRFRETVRGEYKQALLEAIHAARRIGVRENEIVAASVFTTQSLTAILEKIRDQIKAATPEPADFNLGPGGTRTVFPLNEVTGITFNPQTRTDGPLGTPIRVPIELLDIFPGVVGAIAFGRYNSPDYQVHPGEFIPPTGTRTGSPAVRGTNEIYFNVYLPSGPKPAAGWPVAIFGHGGGQNKNLSFNVAATMAAHGVATIAINAVGHGFGPLGTLVVNQTVGARVTVAAGGRGFDQNGDGIIAADEGLTAAAPRTILLFTDGLRQTVADLMQLVRVIEVGMDVDGDGFADLDPSRIYYFGHSLGGYYGTVLLGVEPAMRAGVLTSAGGINIREILLSPSERPALGQSLSSRTPLLINAPGITNLGGVAVSGPPQFQFNENFPLRDGIPLRVRLADGTSQDIQSPVINTVAGAMAIQQVVENIEWASQSGDPVAYAPHLRRNPLTAVPAKSVVYQIAKTDQTVPNPVAAALLRAGDLADRATFYRHDLAFAENPMLPKNPHGFMVRSDILAFRAITLADRPAVARRSELHPVSPDSGYAPSRAPPLRWPPGHRAQTD
jgi:hypothetical protein